MIDSAQGADVREHIMHSYHLMQGHWNRRAFLDRLAGSAAAAVATIPMVQRNHALGATLPAEDARLAVKRTSGLATYVLIHGSWHGGLGVHSATADATELMTALGQLRRFHQWKRASALPPVATAARTSRVGSVVPKAVIPNDWSAANYRNRRAPTVLSFSTKISR
jgi:hypothetical protein